jgi:diguanylate cyclase (GGDEF)-like protein
VTPVFIRRGTLIRGAPVRTRLVISISLTTVIPLLTLFYVQTVVLTGLSPDQRGYLPALGFSTMLLILGGAAIIWDLAREAEAANRRWRELSLTDELTGAYNRRYCEIRLRDEIARSERSGNPFVFLLLDVDHFKRVNDEGGHTAGDQVLRDLCQLIRDASRATNALCRYGGDELAILLPETPLAGALIYAERVRRLVSQATFAPGGPLTVSIGLAAYPIDGRTAEEIREVADASLYAAKADGRNRVGGVPRRGGGAPLTPPAL